MAAEQYTECPISSCDLTFTHGHEGYGHRFRPHVEPHTVTPAQIDAVATTLAYRVRGTWQGSENYWRMVAHEAAEAFGVVVTEDGDTELVERCSLFLCGVRCSCGGANPTHPRERR